MENREILKVEQALKMRLGLPKASITPSNILSGTGPSCPSLSGGPQGRLPCGASLVSKQAPFLLSLHYTLGPAVAFVMICPTWEAHSFEKPLLSARHCAGGQELRDREEGSPDIKALSG